MKAAVHTRYGPPDMVRILDVAKPTIKRGDVQIVDAYRFETGPRIDNVVISIEPSDSSEQRAHRGFPPS